METENKINSVSAIKIRGVASKSFIDRAASGLFGVLLAISLSFFWGQTRAAGADTDLSFFALYNDDSSNICIGVSEALDGAKLQHTYCQITSNYENPGNQLFAWTDDGRLTLKSSLDGPSPLCVSSDEGQVGKNIVLRHCSEDIKYQGWNSMSGSSSNDDEGMSISSASNSALCLDFPVGSSDGTTDVKLKSCGRSGGIQNWTVLGETRNVSPQLVVMITVDGGRFNFPFDKAKEARLNGHSVYSGYGRQAEGGYDKFFKEGTVFDYALHEQTGMYASQGKMTVMTGGNSWVHGNDVQKLFGKTTDDNTPRADCFDSALHPSENNNLINATVNRDEAQGVCTSPRMVNAAFIKNDTEAPMTIVDTIQQYYEESHQQDTKLYGVGLWDTPLIQMMGNAKQSGAKTFWLNRYFSEGRKSSMTSSKYYFPDGSLPVWVNNFMSYYDFLKTQLPLTADGSQFLWEAHLPVTNENYENAAAHQANNPYSVPLNYSTNGNDYQLQGDVFPHTFANDERTAVNLAMGMPQGDAYVLEFSAELVKRESLGTTAGAPDLLVVDLTSPDQIAHAYGTDSVEHEESWYLLDKALGRFMRTLEDRVGKENLLFVLTAGHGFDSTPEWVSSGSAEPNTEKFYMGMDYHVKGPQALRDEARRMYLEPKTINGSRVDITKLVNDAFEAVTNLSLEEGESVVVGYNSPMIRLKPEKVTNLLKTLPSDSAYAEPSGFIELVGDMVAYMNQNKANHHHVEQFYSSAHLVLKPWASLPPIAATRDKAAYFERAAKLATSHRAVESNIFGFDMMTHTSGAAGEIVIVPKPHAYFYDGEEYSAMHSGPYWWDQSVMLMFWGGSIPQLRVEQLKYPVRQRQMVRARDIMPTVARLSGINPDEREYFPVTSWHTNQNVISGRQIPQVIAARYGSYDNDWYYNTPNPYLVDDMENAPVELLGPPFEYRLLGNRASDDTKCLKAVSVSHSLTKKLKVASCNAALGDRQAYWTYMDDYPLYNNNGSFQSFVPRMYALGFNATNVASSKQGACMYFTMKRYARGVKRSNMYMKQCGTKESGSATWRHNLRTSNIGLAPTGSDDWWMIKNMPSFPGVDDQCLKNEGTRANIDSRKCSGSGNTNAQHWSFSSRE